MIEFPHIYSTPISDVYILLRVTPSSTLNPALILLNSLCHTLAPTESVLISTAFDATQVCGMVGSAVSANTFTSENTSANSRLNSTGMGVKSTGMGVVLDPQVSGLHPSNNLQNHNSSCDSFAQNDDFTNL